MSWLDRSRPEARVNGLAVRVTLAGGDGGLGFHVEAHGAERALAAAGSAVAGGKGGKGGPNLRLVILSEPSATEGVAHQGDEVTFRFSTTATEAFVNLRCYQGQAFVFDGWAGFFPGAWFGQTFTLASTYWADGEADCTARLVSYGSHGRERTLGTMGFHVEA